MHEYTNALNPPPPAYPPVRSIPSGLQVFFLYREGHQAVHRALEVIAHQRFEGLSAVVLLGDDAGS